MIELARMFTAPSRAWTLPFDPREMTFEPPLRSTCTVAPAAVAARSRVSLSVPLIVTFGADSGDPITITEPLLVLEPVPVPVVVLLASPVTFTPTPATTVLPGLIVMLLPALRSMLPPGAVASRRWRG